MRSTSAAWQGGISLVVLLVASGVSLGGQQAPPNPLGQPLLDASGQLRDDAFIRIPLRPEDERYADIEGDRLKEMLLEVDAISLADRDAGTIFWGRNVGTASHVATQDWVEGHFRRNGLDTVSRQSFDLNPVWHPTAWELTFASGDQTFTLASARPPQGAPSTPPGGLEFDLVWVGGGSDADYLGRDVVGKAVLIQDIPRPGTLRHSIRDEGSVARAFEKGAAAVGIVYGISDNFAVWQRTGDGPGFNLGYEDGMRLRDRLGRGERVRVRYTMESEQRSGLQAASVWGTLPGVSDEEILIIAHMDGYFRSALDNASGLAVMMGLLEHYAKTSLAERPRTLRFRIGRSPWRAGDELAPRQPGDGARQHGAGHQPGTCRRGPNEILGPPATDDERRVADAMVGQRQSDPARHRARRIQPVQCRCDRRHGGWGVRRDGSDGARRAVDPGHHLARDQAHRAGHA